MTGTRLIFAPSGSHALLCGRLVFERELGNLGEEFIGSNVMLQASLDDDLVGFVRRECFQGRLPSFIPDRDDGTTVGNFLQRLL